MVALEVLPLEALVITLASSEPSVPPSAVQGVPGWALSYIGVAKGEWNRKLFRV